VPQIAAPVAHSTCKSPHWRALWTKTISSYFHNSLWM